MINRILLSLALILSPFANGAGKTNLGSFQIRSSPGSQAASSLFEVNTTSKGALPAPKMTQSQRDGISSPTAGLQVFNTDTNKLNVYNGTAWSEVGSGQGGINYLSPNSNDAESGVGSWAAYADAAATSPADGTGGSPTVTCTRTTSAPLRGVGSFRITKDAANRQGEGCSVPFTIDTADKAKPLTISFDYSPGTNFTSATDSTTGDVVVYVYDVTNSTLIQPGPFKLAGGAGNQWKYSSTFQAASNSTSYRLILHVAGTGTSAWTLDYDNVSVGPQVSLYGAPVSDWTSFTPTGSWSANTTYTGLWRRVGDSMQFVVRVATSGAPTSATLTVNVPSGYSIDTAKLTSAAIDMVVGDAIINDSSTTYYLGSVVASSSSSVTVRNTDDAAAGVAYGNVSQANPITFGAGDSVTLNFQVPIVGWASSVVMSQDTETRVVAAYANRSTTQTITAGSDNEIVFNTATKDTHGAFDTTTGRFTAPVPGFYLWKIQAVITMGATAAADTFVFAKKNGTGNRLARFYTDSLSNGKSYGFVSSGEIYLNAGDYISAFANSTTQNVTLGAGEPNNYFSVVRVSGPATIAPTETVACRYTNTAGTTLTKSSNNTVPYATKDFDTHGAFVTDTFTAPVPGKYAVTVNLTLASGATWASGDAITLEVLKNGSSQTSTQSPFSGTIGASAAPGVTLSAVVNCVAGDTIKINCNPSKASAGNVTLNTSTGYNSVSIERIGN